MRRKRILVLFNTYFILVLYACNTPDFKKNKIKNLTEHEAINIINDSTKNSLINTIDLEEKDPKANSFINFMVSVLRTKNFNLNKSQEYKVTYDSLNNTYTLMIFQNPKTENEHPSTRLFEYNISSKKILDQFDNEIKYDTNTFKLKK